MSSSPRFLPEADRISDLPDSLICHILSFLPTKLAVATSILSKRWIPLWKSVLTLDFDYRGFKNSLSFRHFVWSIILSRDAMLPIQSFRISSGYYDPGDVGQFVHTAVQRGLEIFQVFRGKYDDLLKVAPSILSCRTLVVLKLSFLSIGEIPQSVHLPLLKTLHLDGICFESRFVHVMNLFNGCPSIEDLHLSGDQRYNDWRDSKEGLKGFCNLVRATIGYELKFPLELLHNAKFISVQISLMSRWIYGVPTFHNLTHLELIFNDFSYAEPWPLWVIQVLQHCPKLQNLTIEASLAENKDWNDQEIVPECLSSHLTTCSLRQFNGLEGELQFAKYILVNSKLLRSMTIKSTCYENAKHQMLGKLSSYPRGSLTCKLILD